MLVPLGAWHGQACLKFVVSRLTDSPNSPRAPRVKGAF